MDEINTPSTWVLWVWVVDCFPFHALSPLVCYANALAWNMSTAFKCAQGWAGIPVPGHSQEWRSLIPFPNFGNGFFSFPSRSRISGMDFFHSLPVPEFWEWIFSFPSRSRISGMDFFHSLPVPEFREWIFSIPFPFPNWPFQSRESKGKMGDFKRC